MDSNLSNVIASEAKQSRFACMRLLRRAFARLAMTLNSHFSSVTIKFFHSSTRATCPGQITVVQSS